MQISVPGGEGPDIAVLLCFFSRRATSAGAPRRRCKPSANAARGRCKPSTTPTHDRARSAHVHILSSARRCGASADRLTPP